MLKKSYVYAMISIMFWTTSASAFKLTLKSIDFLSLVLYSNITAVIVLFISNLLFGNLKELMDIRNNLKSIYMGFIVPFLYYHLLFLGYFLLKGQEMLILNNTWQIFLLILSSIFVTKKFKLNEFVGISISFLGIVVMATKGNILSFNISNPFGVLIGLSCAFIWASYWILGSSDNRKIEIKLFYNFLFGTIYTMLFFIFFGKLKLNLNGIIGSVYIGLFEMSITFLIYARALSYKEDIGKISNLMYLIPLISLMLLSIIVKEKIEFYTIISAILIVSGIIVSIKK